MNKHILINGASSGIGRSLAVLLAHKGYTLSLCGRQPDKLQTTLASLPVEQVNLSAHFCVSDAEAVADFVTKANENRPVDILINSVGLNNSREQAKDVPIDTLAWQMNVNCYAPIRFMQAQVPYMQTKSAGCIVNVLSTVCLYSNEGIAAYTASKAALDAYTKVMRKELREDNIKLLSVYPGGVNTEFRPAERPQYLSANDVASAIINMIETPDNVHFHELVLRPQSESNF
ncbi:SDR family NAD(P)-dependent oxidoreductase [Algibacillus agarilyticus]|uniref:SDR family NAD(P)-dependent oxidoreductase n=1 Tax=Algibacillus agarilyticus TaxID=2234133 RepID=UPI000DD0EC8C|nr:SDR family NAD(P)-dependent oxidoreductase [Algibacillus agarilyticus]